MPIPLSDPSTEKTITEVFAEWNKLCKASKKRRKKTRECIVASLEARFLWVCFIEIYKASWFDGFSDFCRCVLASLYEVVSVGPIIRVLGVLNLLNVLNVLNVPLHASMAASMACWALFYPPSITESLPFDVRKLCFSSCFGLAFGISVVHCGITSTWVGSGGGDLSYPFIL